MSKSLKGLYKSHTQAVVEQRAGINIFKLNSNKLCVGAVVQEDLLPVENALDNLLKDPLRDSS